MPVEDNSKIVADFLDYYIAEPNGANQAILITGAWGTGKTQFVRRYFDDREAKAEQRTGSSRLYISLYGVRSQADAFDRIAESLVPLGSNKVAQGIASLGLRVVNGLTRAGLNPDDLAPFKEVIAEGARARVLVFDDLERHAMDSIGDVLGLINDFVERRGFRVIVIANEEAIEDKEFRRTKEKVFSRTLQLRLDAGPIYAAFVGTLPRGRAKDAAAEFQAEALDIFYSAPAQNLRSLRTALMDFDRLVMAVDQSLAKSKAGLRLAFLQILATTLELRDGRITPAELAGIMGRIVWRGMSSRDKEPSAIDDMMARYPSVSWDELIIPGNVLADFLATGTLEVELANKAIQEHPVIAGKASAPVWRLLWNWYDLTRTDYLAARKRLKQELDAMQATHPGVILHLAGIMISLRDAGDPVLGDDVVGYFDSYLKRLLEANALLPYPDVLSEFAGAYAGYGYQADESGDFRQIRTLLTQAVEKALRVKLSAEAPHLFERLKKGEIGLLVSRASGSGEYASLPVLQFVDAAQFAGLLISDYLVNFSLLIALVERYERGSEASALRDEFSWANNVAKEVRRIAATAPPPQKLRIDLILRQNLEKLERLVRATDSEHAVRGPEGPETNLGGLPGTTAV